MKNFSKIILLLVLNLFFIEVFSIEPPTQLIIKVLKPGDNTGDITENNDLITVNYTGWIFDSSVKNKNYCEAKGNMFDSSMYEKFHHKAPFDFVLGKGKVIKGWEIGLHNMKINEKRCLVIPPDFAYGNRRIGNIIKPNSTLIFEVQLLKIKRYKP